MTTETPNQEEPSPQLPYEFTDGLWDNLSVVERDILLFDELTFHKDKTPDWDKAYVRLVSKLLDPSKTDPEALQAAKNWLKCNLEPLPIHSRWRVKDAEHK